MGNRLIPLLFIAAGFAGGCAGEAAPVASGPRLFYLGADPFEDEVHAHPSVRYEFGKPLSSRVLSAIAFERATGIEAHPSRIIDGD